MMEEQLAGYEPLYKQGFNLLIMSEVDGGESFAWKRCRDEAGKLTGATQFVPLIRDEARGRHLVVVTPIHWDAAIAEVIAEADRRELKACTSRIADEAAAFHEVEEATALNMLEAWLTSDTVKSVQEVESVTLNAYDADIEDLVARVNNKEAAASSSNSKLNDTTEKAESMVGRATSDKNVRGAKDVLPLSRARKQTHEQYVRRMCHIGCINPHCSICNMVVGPVRRFVTKVDPFKETRPGYLWSLDMVEFDRRSIDGAKYVPQLRCMACHFIPEMTLVVKDDFYDKFEKLVARMRACSIFKYPTCVLKRPYA